MATERAHAHLIDHISRMPGYSPDAHAGTTNIRLSTAEFCPNFELVLGTVKPGGSADRHYHDTETQVFYVISGEGQVSLGDDPPVRAGPGTVIRIPPGLEHELVPIAGEQPFQVLIVYSPPISRGAQPFKKR